MCRSHRSIDWIYPSCLLSVLLILQQRESDTLFDRDIGTQLRLHCDFEHIARNACEGYWSRRWRPLTHNKRIENVSIMSANAAKVKHEKEILQNLNQNRLIWRHLWLLVVTASVTKNSRPRNTKQETQLEICPKYESKQSICLYCSQTSFFYFFLATPTATPPFCLNS